MSKQLVQTVYVPTTPFKLSNLWLADKETDKIEYVEEKEGIFFTQEEYNKHIKEVIENTLKNGAENAEIDYEEEKTYDFTFVNKDSILNTSEETYLKYKI